VCFSNLTNLDGGNSKRPLITFGQADIDVARCLTNLYFTQDDTCISVAGSSCDNNYSGTGYILNARIPEVAGVGKNSALSASQSSAAQAAFDILVNQNVAFTGDMPEIHFRDQDGTTNQLPSSYQLNLHGPSTNKC